VAHQISGASVLRAGVRLGPCGRRGGGRHIAGHITPWLAAVSNDGAFLSIDSFRRFGAPVVALV
jgi:hypothetical protein